MKAHEGSTQLIAGKFTVTGSTAWFHEPLSEEQLWSDQHYRSFAYGHFGPRAVGHCMLKFSKALCKQQKTKYRRDDEISRIADLLGMKATKLTNLLNRTGRWVPKRR